MRLRQTPTGRPSVFCLFCCCCNRLSVYRWVIYSDMRLMWLMILKEGTSSSHVRLHWARISWCLRSWQQIDTQICSEEGDRKEQPYSESNMLSRWLTRPLETEMRDLEEGVHPSWQPCCLLHVPAAHKAASEAKFQQEFWRKQTTRSTTESEFWLSSALMSFLLSVLRWLVS